MPASISNVAGEQRWQGIPTGFLKAARMYFVCLLDLVMKLQSGGRRHAFQLQQESNRILWPWMPSGFSEAAGKCLLCSVHPLAPVRQQENVVTLYTLLPQQGSVGVVQWHRPADSARQWENEMNTCLCQPQQGSSRVPWTCVPVCPSRIEGDCKNDAPWCLHLQLFPAPSEDALRLSKLIFFIDSLAAFQTAAFALGPGSGDTIHKSFERSVSIPHSPWSLLVSSTGFLRHQKFISQDVPRIGVTYMGHKPFSSLGEYMDLCVPSLFGVTRPGVGFSPVSLPSLPIRSFHLLLWRNN